MPAHEFGSSTWLDALHALLREELSRTPHPSSVAICEVYTNAPAHLALGTDRTISWHCRIDGASLEFFLGEIEQADFKAVIEYDVARVLTKWIHHKEGEQQLSDIRDDAIAQGKLIVQGDRAVILFLQEMHNEIAKITN